MVKVHQRVLLPECPHDTRERTRPEVVCEARTHQPRRVRGENRESPGGENPTGGYFSGGACAARAAWARVQRVRTLSALHDRKRRSQSAVSATLRDSLAFSLMPRHAATKREGAPKGLARGIGAAG